MIRPHAWFQPRVSVKEESDMDLEIAGKVALVTGAGQGVGREIAKTLAAEGARVVINDLYAERAQAVAQEIGNLGGNAIVLQADVTVHDQVKTMIARTVETFGPVDILVNNAGVPVEVRNKEMTRTVFVETRPELWAKDVNLNFYGCLNCVSAVLPAMIKNRSGKIVSITSEAGRLGEYTLAVYSGAKAAVLGFSKAVAREVGRYAINVNCIAIGAAAHEGTKPFLDPEADADTDPVLKKMLKFYPIGQGLGRIGRPSDVAAAVAFLVSSKACFITGQCLGVSGGFNMSS